MKKIKLQLNKRENIKKSFAGQEIEITPYIELDLLSSLVEVIFNSTISDKIEENNNEILSLNIEDKLICLKRFNLAIVDRCTNVDIEEIDTEVLLTSGIDDYIIKFISNYNIGKEMLMSEIKEYNLNATILRMFNDLPSVDDMSSEMGKISKVIETVPESVLTSVATNHLNKDAITTTKQQMKNNKLKS